MKHYLITGIAGTGKSAVGAELKRSGYAVLETDRVPENSTVYRRRYDKRTGSKSDYLRGSGWDELQHVEWRIDIDALRNELGGDGDEIRFVCGYANNWSDLKDVFEGIFLLEASSEVVKHRLLNRITGDWGRKHPEELRHVLETANSYNESIKKLGATVLDAEQPIDILAKKILHYIQHNK